MAFVVLAYGMSSSRDGRMISATVDCYPGSRIVSHRILVFSGGCDLCKDTVRTVEVGKCGECQLEVLDMNKALNNKKTE